MPVNTAITIRKGTGSQWSSANPVLASGEPGYDLSNNILKIGDGVSDWNSLKNVASSSGLISPASGQFQNLSIYAPSYYEGGIEINPAINSNGIHRIYFNGNNVSGSIEASEGDEVLNFSGPWLLNNIPISVSGHSHTASDITNFNSSVSGLFPANLITGVGTSGYLSRWNGANSLTSGVIFDNGTNVGIGATNPSGALHIEKIVANNSYLLLSSPSNIVKTHIGVGNNDSVPFLASTNNIQLASGNYGWGFFDRATDGNLRLARRTGSTSWTDTLHINRNNGNIGVGTTTPSGQLHVVGSGLFSGDVTASGSFIGGSGTAALPSFEFIGDVDTGLFSPAADTFAISTSGVERLRVNNIGRIGIGNSNPQYALDVSGSGNFLNGLAISGVPIAEVIDDEVAGLLVAGSGISLNYNDIANTLTVDTNVSTSLVAGTGISLVYNVTTDELSINTSGVSLVGHSHVSSDITNFNSTVNGLVSGIYAPLNNPALTGTPTVPTASSGTNTNQIASTAFVRNEITNLINSAPSTLDTLNELAIALGNDANFSTTVTNSLAGKANLSGAAFTGSISSPSGNFTQSLQVNGTGVSLSGHSHGNITSSGTIGASGNKVLITDVDGVIITTDYAPKSQILYDPVNNWDILFFSDATPVWGAEAILNDVHIQLRDSIFASPLVHSHGNINSSGQIGSVANRVITTSDSGLLVANSDAQFECSAIFIGISGDYIANGGMVLAPEAIIFSDNTVQETAYTGKIGSTANVPLITTTSGIITSGTFGTTANSFCQGNDSRLSDSRTPLSHTHGNITNAGAIGSTANLPLITTTAGAITTGSFGSSVNTFCQGNDSRLSDSRTPLSHTHGNITNAGAIGSTANLPLITTTAGAITAGSFGNTANSFCQGNDSRLSDTRTPTDGTVTTAKIVDANVTYAKIQNVSATDRILGRSGAGAGVVQEITCTSFGRSLIDDADAATARSTLGLVTPTFTDTATVTSSSTFVGMRLRSNLDTTAAQSAGFLSSANQNGIEDSSILLLRNPDGSTSMTFSNTAAGSKTVDRRHTQLVLSSNGFWDCTVAGAVASGVKPACFCRGWVVFNGTSTPSIIGAINFSSITDNGVGDYTLNLGVSMPDTLYAIIGSANWDGQSRAGVVGQNSQRTKTTTAVPVVVMQGATNTLFDTSNISVAIFR